jgi:Transmembrane protein 33/Nucleoporin POM33
MTLHFLLFCSNAIRPQRFCRYSPGAQDSSTYIATMSTRAVSYPHLAWAAGHVLVLLGTVYDAYTIVTTFGMSTSSRAYFIALAGAILSWGIVVYKSLGVPNFSRAYMERAFVDENCQYLILALFLYFQVRSSRAVRAILTRSSTERSILYGDCPCPRAMVLITL